MTPQEANHLMDLGLAPRLMKDWLEPCKQVGNDHRIWTLAPASIGYEGQEAPDMPFEAIFTMKPWSKGQCTFLQNGLCEIHDHKPTQCRLAYGCQMEKNETCPSNYDLAKLWDNEEGRRAVARWDNNNERQNEEV
jgi:Fe-S-cluster containining protein